MLCCSRLVMLIERWGKCWPSVTPSSAAVSTSAQSEQQQQPIFVHQMSGAQCLEPCLAPVRGHYFIHASSHSKHADMSITANSQSSGVGHWWYWRWNDFPDVLFYLWTHCKCLLRPPLQDTLYHEGYTQCGHENFSPSWTDFVYKRRLPISVKSMGKTILFNLYLRPWCIPDT